MILSFFKIILYISTIVNTKSRNYNENDRVHSREENELVIKYDNLYKTMKKKDITTYKLINTYGLSRSLIDRLKHNKPITTVTLDDLCKILDCNVEDVLSYEKDPE